MSTESRRRHFIAGAASTACHRPANVTASGPAGVIQKKSRKISDGQKGLPRRPGSSPAVEDGASQGARSSLARDWRWPLPHRTVRIVSMNSVSGSVPPVPMRSVGPVHDTAEWRSRMCRSRTRLLDANRRLKQLVADLSLDNQILKHVLGKK